jgi:hypothetical protein
MVRISQWQCTKIWEHALKKGEDDAVAEKMLIAQICLAAENSRK